MYTKTNIMARPLKNEKVVLLKVVKFCILPYNPHLQLKKTHLKILYKCNFTYHEKNQNL